MGQAAIATTTFYRSVDDLRMKLALKTMEEACRNGFPIAVVDGGSPDEVCRQFHDRAAYLYRQEKPGMGASRRQAIAAAAKLVNNNEVIIWMEPEKHTLVSEFSKIVPLVLNGKADLVVPARRTMASYPPEQQTAEVLGNLAFFYLTGFNFDVWFGPRVMNRRAVQYFLDYQGEYGDKWDSIFIPLLRMIKDGLHLMDFMVDYVHPQEQTQAEANFDFLMKRLDQLSNLVPSMGREAMKIGLIR